MSKLNFNWFPDQNWALVTVTGSDRKDFLGRLTTNKLPGSESPLVHNFFLSVNARVEAEFWVSAREDRLLLLTPAEQVQALKSCIDRYHFGEKVKAEEPSGELFVIQGERPDFLETATYELHPDPRYGEDCYWCFVAEEQVESFRQKLTQGNPWDLRESELRRIKMGRPKFGVDYDSESLFVEIAQQEDFSETKGCYPGQEIVARVLHRGRLNRHLRGFESAQEIPSSWFLKIDGKEVARVKSTIPTGDGGSIGYLMVRREYGQEGQPLTGSDENGREWTLTVVPRQGEVLTGTEE